jgi:repressor LexA
MVKGLTNRQREVYDFIHAFSADNGYAPSIRDVASNFGFSVKGAYDHILALQKKGYISRDESKTRSIVCLKGPGSETSIGRTVSIPLVGRVAAGTPVLAEQNIEERLRFDPGLVPDGEGCFALRVSGDSMVNAGILDGDTIIVQPRGEYRNGEIVVVMAEGMESEATVKRFYREKGRIRLVAENPDFEDIVLSEGDRPSILGRVAGVFRSL